VPSERCVKGLNTSTVNCDVKALSVRMLFFKTALFDVKPKNSCSALLHITSPRANTGCSTKHEFL
jgi:hypothetical protein